ncbi:MAG: phosphoadenosine phosphosulfate reductase family protein [Phycisphaerales bacterium]|nr:phosphoadenosine phosphosulfate reductase family protein [Phycisphaerales bacterium]
MSRPIRHVVSLSGGKDSAAMAIYLRDRLPELDYVFSDTDKELPETYDYLARIEAFLGKQIIRLRADRGFDHWLQIYGGYLPSPRMRWCTKMLKIRPFEAWVEELGDVDVQMYVGIRADENRGGYKPTKPNITPVYPFIEAGITLDGVHRILEESGVGVPPYYSWRTRSGCFFCFYQRKHEWVGLKENHPDLFELAKQYEKTDQDTGQRYTWSERESLAELEQPARVEEINTKFARQTISVGAKSKALVDILDDSDDDDENLPCSFCHV